MMANGTQQAINPGMVTISVKSDTTARTMQTITAAMTISVIKMVMISIRLMQGKRKKLHDAYTNAFKPLEQHGLRMTFVPENVETNYHAFWLLFNNEAQRDKFLQLSLARNISPYIGYIALHSSPMGKKLGGDKFNLPFTDHVSKSIARLPFYLMSDEEIEYTCANLYETAKLALEI